MEWKYIKEGLTRVNARIKTEDKMHTNDIKQFLNKYGTLIQYILQLKHWSIHASVFIIYIIYAFYSSLLL